MASTGGARLDANGNIYVADYRNSVIRKINLVRENINFRVNFADAAGNSGSVDNTTNNSLVEVDLEAPTLTKVEVSSSNANTQGQTDQLAKAGESITLTVESSEALKSLSVGDGQGNPTPLNPVGDSGREWTLSDTVESGDNGELSFVLTYEDLVGNDGASVSNTTNNSKITFDTTAPTLSSVTLASSN